MQITVRLNVNPDCGCCNSVSVAVNGTDKVDIDIVPKKEAEEEYQSVPLAEEEIKEDEDKEEEEEVEDKEDK